MRLIDAVALKEALSHKPFLGFDWYHVEKALEEAPTIDPVKHGKWDVIYFDEPSECDIYGCSECKKTTGIIRPEWNYCPNCGAKMEDPDGRR